jgi:hypothetical protein
MIHGGVLEVQPEVDPFFFFSSTSFEHLEFQSKIFLLQ